MEGLIRTRAGIRSKLTNFKNYVNKVCTDFGDPNQPLDELKALEIRERVNRMRETYNSYDQIQGQIEVSSNEQETAEYRERFENEYFNTIAQTELLLSRQSPKVSAINVSAAQNSQTYENVNQVASDATQTLPNLATRQNQQIILKSASVRLPTIELPKFNGDIADWLSFRDTFESLINKNETIDPIQKFHYLKASLEGPAAQIIKSLEFSAANYTVAWNAICSRFNNKRLLAHNHIKAIVNIGQMKQESAVQIRETIDTLNKHLRALNALEQPTEHWDTLLIYLISTKLDNITAKAWEQERANNDIPTLKDFKSFLSSRADLLDSIEMSETSNSKMKQNERAKIKTFLLQRQKCTLCKEAHQLANCKQFLEFTPQKRAEHLKKTKLCLML